MPNRNETPRLDSASHAKTSERSIYLGFLLGFLICTGLASLVFVIVWRAGWVGSEVGPVADTIGAILGFSAGISGATVAMTLALRSLRQADESNRLNEQITQLTQLTTDIERQRETDLKVAEVMSQLETLAASAEAVTSTARALYQATDVAESELQKNHQTIENARGATVNALRRLADDLSSVSRDHILDTAWLNNRKADKKIHQLINHYRDMITSFEVREQQREEIRSWYGHNEEQVHVEQPGNEPIDGLKSEWRSFEDKGETHAIKYWVDVPTSASDFANLVRKMAADLAAANAEELWHRAAFSRFALFIQACAVYDSRELGGYHMPPNVSKQSKDFFGKEKIDFEGLVLNRSWVIMSNTQTARAPDPLLIASLLAPPVYPFYAINMHIDAEKLESSIREPLNKAGRLPYRPLALNQAALFLVHLSASVPDGEAIIQAAAIKFPQLGDLLATRLDEGRINAIIRSIFHPMLTQAAKEADKIFLPLPPIYHDHAPMPQHNLTKAHQDIQRSMEGEGIDENDEFLMGKLHCVKTTPPEKPINKLKIPELPKGK